MTLDLRKYLASLEETALSFCTPEEWAQVEAEVLEHESLTKTSFRSTFILRKAAREVIAKKVDARQFGSRSDAGRYAASIRWNSGRYNRQQGTGFNRIVGSSDAPRPIPPDSVGDLAAGKKAVESAKNMRASKPPTFGVTKYTKKLIVEGAKAVQKGKNFEDALRIQRQIHSPDSRGEARAYGGAKVLKARWGYEDPTMGKEIPMAVPPIGFEKAERKSFGSRSEAGRYAASIRWSRARGEGAGAGGATPPSGEPPKFGAPGTNQAWEDYMAQKYESEGFSPKDARERAVFDRKVGESPQGQAQIRMREEAEQLRQTRERMGQAAVDAERERTARMIEQEANLNLGIAMGSSSMRIVPVSAEAPTAQQMKSFAGKLQTGAQYKLAEYTDDAGQKYLMNEGRNMAMRVMGEATKITPKGSIREGISDEMRANINQSVARVINTQQERVANLSPAEFKAKMVTPVGVVQQVLPRSSRPGAKVDTTDTLVLDVGGKIILADARHYAGIQKAFPNATAVQPVKDQNINFVDSAGTVMATMMPLRTAKGAPDVSTSEFQQRASNMLAQMSPQE